MLQRIRIAVVVALLVTTSATYRAAESTPAEVFEKRIVPIFQSPNPSSCVQCHLAGVDLKNYFCRTQRRRFAACGTKG